MCISCVPVLDSTDGAESEVLHTTCVFLSHLARNSLGLRRPGVKWNYEGDCMWACCACVCMCVCVRALCPVSLSVVLSSLAIDHLK